MKIQHPLNPAQAANVDDFIDVANNYTLLKYYQNVTQLFSYANNFGIAIDDNDQSDTGGKAVLLKQLFVPPHLSRYYTTPEQVVDNETKQQAVDSLSIAQLLKQHPRLFILGDPGVGKSTLINFLMLAFSYSGKNTSKLALGERVPFPLILRDLPLQTVTNWDELWQVFLNEDKNKKELTAPLLNDSDTINQLLNSGQALIMLDGLDEITNTEQRHYLAEAIYEAMNRYPRCLFLISSRVIGFNQSEWFGLQTDTTEHNVIPVKTKLIDSELDNIFGEVFNDIFGNYKLPKESKDLLPYFYLTPFNEEQVEQFITNWYTLYVSKQVNHKQRIFDLKECLKANDGLKRLARIPVLLNLICFIHARRGRLPDGRAELYQRIAETYLISLDKERGLKFKGQELRFDYYDLSEWLGDIAYALQERRTEKNNSLFMSGTEVRQILLKGLLERGFSGEQAQQESQFILEYFSHRSGLFIERDNGLYAFTHLSFLEYFAACHLKLKAPLLKTKKEWEFLKRRTYQVCWHETFALFFETVDNAKLAEQYLGYLFSDKLYKSEDKLTIQENLLADIIMDTSVRLSLSVRQQYIKQLAEILLNDNSKRHLAFRLCTERYQAVEYIKTATNINFNDTAFNNSSLLAQFTNLNYLYLMNTNISNLDGLKNLTQLKILDIDYCTVTDIKALEHLQQLIVFYMNGVPITDFSPLSNLKNLNTLWLSSTSIIELSVLENLEKLSSLHLSYTKIKDLNPLAKLKQLKKLFLNFTEITDLQVVANLTKLEELSIYKTPVTDLSPLIGLSSLKELDIRNTKANPRILKKHLPNLKIIK